MTEILHVHAGFHRPSVNTLLFWPLRMSDPMSKDGPIIVRRNKPQGVALPPPPELTGESPSDSALPVPLQSPEQRLITQAEFQRLADIPPEAEWFANITNPNTRRAYRNDVGQFMKFVGIEHFTDFRIVARAHVIAWRKSLEDKAMAPATIRRKLSALSDLFDYLCKENAIVINPVHGVERPTEGAN
jgi:hypothetical protein